MPNQYDLLKKFWEIGFVLTVSTAFFLLSLDRLKAQLLAGNFPGILGLGALFVSVFWMLDLTKATLNELDLFHDHKIIDRVSVPEWQVFSIVAAVALGLGGLIAAVTFPIIYCILATTIQIVDCIGVSIIQRAFFKAHQKLPDFNPVLYEYYLYKPHFMLRAGKLVGFMSALVLSVAAQFSNKPSYSVASWILVIVTILGGESVLIVWRSWRNKRLTSPDQAVEAH